MKDLREIYEAKIKILSEKKTKDGETMSILAPWIVSDRKNKNGRLYPLSLIKREVAKVQSSIKAGSMISSADHPFGVHTTLADASHIIRKLEVDKDGRGWMEATILPTTKGKNVMTIVKAGGQLGISARGAGTVSPSGIVGNDYKLLGIDFCTSPSEPEAVFNKDNVFESAEFEEEERNEALEEAINELEKESFLGAVESGFKGTEKEWSEKYGSNLREMMGLPKKENEKTPVEKLTEEQVKARTYSYYQEAVQAGFKGTFDEWKDAYPRLVESASKVKIVETKKEKKEPIKLRTNWNEVVASGFVGTHEEFREKYPQIELVMPASPQEKIVVEKILTKESLRQEAGRIFTALSADRPNSQLTLEDVVKMLEKEEIAKADQRLRKRAIYIVNTSLAGSGSAPSQEMLSQMILTEIENLKRQREERRKRNWECYKKLLD